MNLHYLPYAHLRRKVSASRPTLWWLWLLQQVSWLFLRLEGPAWQQQAAQLLQLMLGSIGRLVRGIWFMLPVYGR